MIKLKGYTQLVEHDINKAVNLDEARNIWLWAEDPDKDTLLVKCKDDDELAPSGWANEGVPARDHSAFSNFHIWFEYDT